jgi:hypothetical protein
MIGISKSVLRLLGFRCRICAIRSSPIPVSMFLFASGAVLPSAVLFSP